MLIIVYHIFLDVSLISFTFFHIFYSVFTHFSTFYFYTQTTNCAVRSGIWASPTLQDTVI